MKSTFGTFEINKLTGEFEFVENIGNNSQSIYVPIVGLKRSRLLDFQMNLGNSTAFKGKCFAMPILT